MEHNPILSRCGPNMTKREPRTDQTAEEFTPKRSAVPIYEEVGEEEVKGEEGTGGSDIGVGASDLVRGAERARKKPLRRRDRLRRNVAHGCIGVAIVLLLVSLAVPTLVFVLAHSRLVITVMRGVFPEVEMSGARLSGLLTVSVFNPKYKWDEGRLCVAAARIDVSVSPISVMRWAFGAASHQILVYGVNLVDVGLYSGANCTDPVYGTSDADPEPADSVPPPQSGWEYDWATILRVAMGEIPPIACAAPGAMDAASSALASLGRSACSISLDVARFTANAADGSFSVSASWSTIHSVGTTALAYLDAKSPFRFSIAAAYRSSAGCTVHGATIGATLPSGLSATAVCTAAFPAGAACSAVAAANVLGVATGSARLSFAAAPLSNGSAWLATVSTSAQSTAPLRRNASTEFLVAASRSPPDGPDTAVGLLFSSNFSSCAAILASTPPCSEVLGHAWNSLAGSVFAGGETAAGLADARTVGFAALDVDARQPSPHVRFGSARYYVQCAGSPDWVCSAASASLSLAASAAASNASLSGSLPLVPWDPTGNYRIVFDLLHGGAGGIACDSILIDGERIGGSSILASKCSGALAASSTTQLNVTCNATEILGVITFIDPSICVSTLPNSTGANLRISSGEAILNSGVRVHLSNVFELEIPN